MRNPTLALVMLLAACGGTGTAPATPVVASGPGMTENDVGQAPAAVQPAPDTQSLAMNTKDIGAIAGTLSYPSEALPAMRVCAFALEEGASHCISSTPGQRVYRIDDIPRGEYQVLAYPRDGSGAPGGYTGCVDDLSASCTGHDLRVVVVEAGKTTHDIDPADFYAGDAGVDWPAEP